LDSSSRKRELVARLRKLVLHSADTLPGEVSAYINRVAGKPRAWEEKEQLLREYRPVARHLPIVFVDFALGYLIEARRTRQLDWSQSGPDQLGVRRVMGYSPAAPVQGPFLYLLGEHEREGLRLVHGLVNAATTRWRENGQRGSYGAPPRTPIPLKLNLPGGDRTFWGDDQIYRWFRGTAAGPRVVVSALMALEMWIEQQLASGRDATGLFLTVLEGTESVAVLGVLVSAALAHPGLGLDVLLPLVANARLWHMDLLRLRDDQSETPVIDFLGSREEINRILLARNKLTHRRVHIRAIIPFYLFGERLRDVFAERVRTFGDSLPFEFEEESTNALMAERLRNRLTDFRASLNPANYRFSLSDDGRFIIEFVPPQDFAERDPEGMEAQARIADALAIKMWSRKSLDQGTIADGMSATEAIHTARSLQLEDDFVAPSSIDTHGLDHARLEAIVEVAATVLTVIPRPDLGAEEMVWLRSVLLAGAITPRTGLVIPTSYYPSDLKVSAALGLGALVSDGQADQEVREALISLIDDAEHQVVSAVFCGLRGAWSRDPVLCWNCLSLAISMCCVPNTAVVTSQGLRLNDSGKQWLTGLREAHLERLKNGTIPELPTIGDRESIYFRSERMASLLEPLLVHEIAEKPEGKQGLLRLHDSLMARTLQVEVDEVDGPSYSTGGYDWEGRFLRWSAQLANTLTPDEEEAHVIRPVWATWPERPRILEEFLLRYLSERLNSMGPLPNRVVANWQRLWNLLLDSPELRSRSHRPSSSSQDQELDTLAVFVASGAYIWEAAWPHAPRFESLIDRWVRTVGVSHICYHALVTMLKPNADRFAPGIMLGWLEHVAKASKDVRALWAAHDNGTRTTEFLMLLRTKQSEALVQEGLNLRFAKLVDRLTWAGIPAASLLQRELEARE
jgi:hypothetical protein